MADGKNPSKQRISYSVRQFRRLLQEEIAGVTRKVHKIDNMVEKISATYPKLGFWIKFLAAAVGIKIVLFVVHLFIMH